MQEYKHKKKRCSEVCSDLGFDFEICDYYCVDCYDCDCEECLTRRGVL